MHRSACRHGGIARYSNAAGCYMRSLVGTSGCLAVVVTGTYNYLPTPCTYSAQHTCTRTQQLQLLQASAATAVRLKVHVHRQRHISTVASTSRTTVNTPTTTLQPHSHSLAMPSSRFVDAAVTHNNDACDVPQQYNRLLLELSSQLRPSHAPSSSMASSGSSHHGKLVLVQAGQETCRQLAQLLAQHPDAQLQPEAVVKTAQLLSIIHKHVSPRVFSTCCMPLAESLLHHLCSHGALDQLSLRQTSILLQAMVHLPCSSHQQLLQQGMQQLQQLGPNAWTSKEVSPATVSCVLWSYASGSATQPYSSAFLKPLLEGVQAAVQAGVMNVKGAASHWSSALLSCTKLQVPVTELQPVWQQGVQALTHALLQATAQKQHSGMQQHGIIQQQQQRNRHHQDVHVTPQDISSTLWACVAVGYHDAQHDGAAMRQLLAAVGNAIEAGFMDAASPLQWAHLFWARSQLEPSPTSHDLAVMSQHLHVAVSANHLKHATPTQWANLLWGASRLGIAVSDLHLAWEAAIPVLQTAMKAGKSSCSAQDVSMALVASARSKHVTAYNTWLAAAAAGAAQGGLLDDADAGSLAWILWALAEDWPSTCGSADLREAVETLTSSCTLQLTGQVEEGGRALLQVNEGQQNLPRAVAALSSMDVMPPALHAAVMSQELA